MGLLESIIEIVKGRFEERWSSQWIFRYLLLFLSFIQLGSEIMILTFGSK